MAAALEPVNADRIAADPLGGQRVAHRSAFVDDPDAVCLQSRDVLAWIAAGGLDNAHAALDNRMDVFRIGRRRE